MKEENKLTEIELEKIRDYFDGNDFPSSVWWRKYRVGDEKLPTDMFNRIATEFADIEKEFLSKFTDTINPIDVTKLSEYGKGKFLTLMDNQNNGLSKHNYFNLINKFKRVVFGGSVMQGVGAENYSSLSNCFVMGQPVDSYAGIVHKELEILQTCKRRGGNGIDVSTIRPEKAPVNNQSKVSNGPLLFVDRYNHGILEVSQNGRRGALMISMHIKHPDSEKFIVSKQNLDKFTGCNISVKIDNEFMIAALNEQPYMQMFPVDFDFKNTKEYDVEKYNIDLVASIANTLNYDELTTMEFNLLDGTKKSVFFRKINANKLWKTLINCSWKTGEPGIIFEDNHYDYSPDSVYPQYKQVTTNPCYHEKTNLLTETGYYKIGNLVGKEVNIWNGKEWSLVTVEMTGVDQMMYKVTLSDGTEVNVTGEHNWPTTKGKKTTLELIDSKDDSYNGKFTLEDFKLPIISYGNFNQDGLIALDYMRFGNHYFDGPFVADANCYDLLEDAHINNRIVYVKAILDTYACLSNDGFSIHIDNCHLAKLKHLKLILSTLGVYAPIIIGKEKSVINIHDYYLKELFKIGVRFDESYGELYGIESMLETTFEKPSNNIIISSIEEIGIVDKVFCLTEEKRNMVCVDGIVSGNCGEIFMQPYDSCRLLAINLSSYVLSPYTELAEFDSRSFYRDCYEQLWTGNMLVELEIKYVQKIIDKIKNTDEPEEFKNSELNLWKKIQDTAKKGRRCGCGFLALGDLFAQLEIRYGCEASKDLIDKVMAIKLAAELDATIDLAIIDKPFDGFNFWNEYEYVDADSLKIKGKNKFYQFLLEAYPEKVERMRMYGRSNISWSTVAPTGSLAILTQTTSGIEPCFLPMYKRRKKVITSDERVDFVDVDGQKFTEFYVLHEGFKKWLKINIDKKNIKDIISVEELKDIDSIDNDRMELLVKLSPYYLSCANDIPPMDRIQIQSIVQKYISHSISSTVNLKEEATEDDVKFIYEQAWKHKLKGITVYRDGSRQGIMVSSDGKLKDINVNEFESNKAPKRPKTLKAHYYTIEYRRKTYSVIVGLLLDKPYELFICSGVDDLPLIIDGTYIEGELVKESKNWYYFKNDYVHIKDIQDCQSDEKLTSLMVSGLLRHRTPLQFVIKMIQKSNPLVSTVNSKLCKILGKYVENGTEDGSKCPDCGEHLRFESGCVLCHNCGFSKC